MTLEEVVLSYITAHPGAGRDEIRRFAAPEASETTIWRALRRLVDQNQLTVTGRGRATRYSLAGTAVVRAHLRIPYTRRSPVGYKKEFIDRYIPNRTFYLTQADRARLHENGTPVGEPVPAATCAPDSRASAHRLVMGVLADGGQHVQHPRDRAARSLW